MSAGHHPDESWDGWTTRLARDLAALTEGEWMTFTVHVDAAAATDHPTVPRRGWRRVFAPSPARAVPPDVFLQARLVAGVLGLECIADTEFEGLSDLTDVQQDRLLALGWDRERREPVFTSTHEVAQAGTAADLLAGTLRDVLGAPTPSLVDVRRAGHG